MSTSGSIPVSAKGQANPGGRPKWLATYTADHAPAPFPGFRSRSASVRIRDSFVTLGTAACQARQSLLVLPSLPAPAHGVPAASRNPELGTTSVGVIVMRDAGQVHVRETSRQAMRGCGSRTETTRSSRRRVVQCFQSAGFATSGAIRRAGIASVVHAHRHGYERL